MVPSLGVKTLRSGPPWSLTRDLGPEVAGGDPRLARLEQGDRVGGLVGQLQDVRLELLEQVLGLGDLVGGHAVGIAHPRELAHVGHDLDRLVLHDDPLLVLRVDEDLPRIGGRGDVRRVVVDLDRRPPERVAEVAFRLRPDRERASDRVELLRDLERVDVPRLDEARLEVVGYPQGVARDHVDLAADLLDLGIGVDVVAEQRRVDLDVVRRGDGVDLGLVPVVTPGHPVERSGRGGGRGGGRRSGSRTGRAGGRRSGRRDRRRGGRTGGEDAAGADSCARRGSHLEELPSAVFAHQISHSTLLLASST